MRKESFKDALAELQRRFVEQLPQRVAAIAAEFAAWSGAPPDEQGLQRLVHLAHGLVGSAGTFGLAGLSDAARRLELAALAMLREPAAATAAAWQQARALLDDIERCAQQVARPSPLLAGAETAAAPGARRLLKFVAAAGSAASQGLYEGLAARGYRLQRFEDIASLLAAGGHGDEPAAVLVDARQMADELAALQAIASLGLGSARGTPLLWLAAAAEPALALAALRAGVDRYLSWPQDEYRLDDAVDTLAGRQPPQPYRALLVDDDPLELAAHGAVLRNAGIEVTTLTDPMAVFAELERGDIDVLLLDVDMPGVSGPELAAAVRQYDAHLDLPILFLSAERDARQQLLALDLGGDDFLVKPIAADHLVAAVVARARRARQAGALRNRLQTLLYERDREHLAIEQHAIVSVTDAQGRISYVNDRFCQVSGFAREELLGQDHRLLKSGLHDEAFYAQLWRTITAGQVWQGELCNRRKDGRLYWVKSTITPFLDDRGKPYQYVSIRTDVSRLMRHDRALRQLALASSAAGGEGFFAAVAQGLAQALDADVAFVVQCQAGQAGQQLLALWPAGTGGAELFALPAQGLPWEEVLAGRAQTLGDGASRRFPALRAFGPTMPQSYVGVPLHDAQGVLIGHIGVLDARPLADADEALTFLQLFAARVGDEMLRLRAQAELLESEERLRSTLGATKDGILAIDDQRRVVFMNRQFRELWRIDPALADVAGAQDEGLLQQVREQLVDPQGFLERVREIYASEGETTDLLEFGDGRVFERHSRRLHAHGQARVWSFHDVTERLRAEREAQLHKERLRRGQLFANIGTWEWDIRSGELFWTERIAPLFGYAEGELDTSYENFLAAIHPEDRQAVIDAVDAAVHQGAPYEIEHRVVWPDGTVRWLHERGAVERDERGEPLRMLGVVMDIDERKRTALALAEREQQLLEAQRLASMGNWSADMASGALQWSDEIYRIFGHQPGSFAPSVQAFAAAVHPDDLALVRASEDRARLSGHHDVVHRIVRPDGSVRHVHERARAETDADGKLLRMSGTVQDVTELVEAEARLRETEDRFVTAVESTGDGIWDWDIASGAMPLAGHYEAMLGYAKGEIEPHITAWTDGVHPEDMPEVQRRLQEYIEGRSAGYAAELRMRCKDGSYKWILCRGAAVSRDAQGKPLRMVGTHTDISERKAIEASLREAREAAERASRAKSDFLSSMSHELRTPLNAILGFAQLLEYGEELADEQLDSVNEILKAGRHLLELIDEVLDLARVESGSVKLTLEPVELDALVAESLTLMQPLAERRQLTVLPAAGSLGTVLADRTRLKQVLLNLLSNALKYNREGGTVFIERQPAEGGRLRLCVRDTGMGIARDKLALLFQPFSRLDAERLGIEGTGIGLTITRRLVEMMGGSVGVHSEPGQGSSFWIDLPQSGAPAAVAGAVAGEAVVPAVTSMQPARTGEARQRVLYVEDNPANLRLVEQIFLLLPDLQLQSAELPSRGIELALAEPPDLVLLDINMPEMDGYELLARLRAEPRLREVPMVAISANAMPGAIERGLEAGFDAYLTKPLNVQQFLATLESLLQGQAGDRQN